MTTSRTRARRLRQRQWRKVSTIFGGYVRDLLAARVDGAGVALPPIGTSPRSRHRSLGSCAPNRIRNADIVALRRAEFAALERRLTALGTRRYVFLAVPGRSTVDHSEAVDRRILRLEGYEGINPSSERREYLCTLANFDGTSSAVAIACCFIA